MKAFNVLGFLLLGLLGLFFTLGLIMPKTYSVERSIVVRKPSAEVFRHVVSLREQQRWSPWADLDPAMVQTYTGPDGTVGSRSAWAGNSEVGKGEQVIRAIKVNELVHNEVRFIEPFGSVGQAYIQLREEGTSTRVRWQMTGENPFPWNAFSALMNLDETIGKDFDKGLNKLKAISEQ